MTDDNQSGDFERKRLEDWETTAARLRDKLSGRLSGERLDQEMQRLEEGYYRRRSVNEELALARSQKGAYIEQVLPILERVDPVRYSAMPGYNRSQPDYEEEAALIAWHLDEAETCDDLAQIVNESFTRVWAPLNVQSPGYLKDYVVIAQEIWAVMGEDD